MKRDLPFGTIAPDSVMDDLDRAFGGIGIGPERNCDYTNYILRRRGGTGYLRLTLPTKPSKFGPDYLDEYHFTEESLNEETEWNAFLKIMNERKNFLFLVQYFGDIHLRSYMPEPTCKAGLDLVQLTLHRAESVIRFEPRDFYFFNRATKYLGDGHFFGGITTSSNRHLSNGNYVIRVFDCFLNLLYEDPSSDKEWWTEFLRLERLAVPFQKATLGLDHELRDRALGEYYHKTRLLSMFGIEESSSLRRTILEEEKKSNDD